MKIVFGIVPRFNNLSNTVNKVNNCLTLISGQRDIPIVSHSETIDKSKHLNGRKVQLNCSGLKDFAENQASHVSKSKF